MVAVPKSLLNIRRIVFLITSLGGCFLPTASHLDPGVETTIGSCAPTPCVKVHLAGVPELPSGFSREVVRKVQDEIARILYLPVDSETLRPSSAHVVRELTSRLEESEAISDAPIDWMLSRRVEVSSVADEFIGVEIINDGYLGGAHGFHEMSLLMFDGRNGATLSIDDLVSNDRRATFARIVEAEFRRARNIPMGQSLFDAGFFVPVGEELPLPKNWMLTESSLELHYNSYEVGPYVLGSTRLSLPREAVIGVLRERFGRHMKEKVM